jgi:hypothetical protein
MRVIELSDLPQNLQNTTQNIQNISSLLGKRTTALGLMARTRKDLTISTITQGLGRVIVRDRKSSYESVNAMQFTWRIETNMIPKVTIMEDCTSSGSNRQPIALILEKNYYATNDTFSLEDNVTQLRVIQAPEKMNNNRWRYTCVLVNNDMSRGLNTQYTTRGRRTMFRSNIVSDGSVDQRNQKGMLKLEEHRGYITRVRVDGSWTNDAKMIYFEAGQADNKQYFKMEQPAKAILDQFLYMRENSMLLGRDNHDINGNCLDHDSITGAALDSGDGVLAQIERYCDKFFYTKLTTSIFEDAIDSIVKKTGKTTGNNITVVCNWIGYKQISKALEDKLRSTAIDGGYYWTKNGGDITVGGSFKAYQWMGNTINFTVDTILSEIYDKYGYALFIDTTMVEGRANVSMFTLKGREMIEGTLPGLGGVDGMTSGTMGSTFDGTTKSIIGYSGVAVFNPYAGFIMQENI